MKYLNFILTLLAICLITLSCVIYYKPTPNRYRFVTKEHREDKESQMYIGVDGYTIQDTATGKIYEWTAYTTIIDRKPQIIESLTIKDPVNNKVFLKIPKKDTGDTPLGIPVTQY